MSLILITGASSGIGEALALEWSKKPDVNLVLAARGKEALQRVKSECESRGAKAKIVEMDLGNPESIENAAREILDIHGCPDFVIHNGGISQRARATETEMDVYRRLMEVNYMGTVHLTKLLLPKMLTRKSGHFVVVTSVTGKIGTPFRTGYAASKHALHGFFDSLRAEVCHDGLKVTLICPGYVRTSLSFNALSGDGSKHNKMDTATDGGLDPQFFAQKMIAAVEAGQEEACIGGAKEVLGVYLKRFAPGLLSKIVSKAKVT